MARISIAGLLGFVVAFAVGFAGLVKATDLWVGATITLTLAVLLGSVLGILLRGWRGGASAGFALFGWAYFLASLGPVGISDHLRLLSDPPARWAFDRSNAEPASTIARSPPPAVASAALMQGYRAFQDHRHRRANAGLIGHWLAILAFAMGGAVLGTLMARRRPAGVAAAPPPDRLDRSSIPPR